MKIAEQLSAYFELDSTYSTTRRVTERIPIAENGPEANMQFRLFLDTNFERKAEGGLRKKGYFKTSEKHKPLISVVTAVYNGEKFLEQAIKSVLTQSYDNVELIVIDGGSTDGTLDIIKKYDKQINYWVSEPDHGLYDALAKGFSLASGDIFSWLNADDIYYPWSFEKVAETMRTGETQWITGIPTWIQDKSTIPKIGYVKVYPKFLINYGYAHGEGWGFIQQESTFFSRKLYMKVGGIDKGLRLAADFLLWKKMAHYSKLTSVNCPLAAFRIQDKQLSGDISEYYTEVYRYGGKKFKILCWFRKLLTLLMIIGDVSK
jgi:glycosyltransferase involved in cell wall biosynthesis